MLTCLPVRALACLTLAIGIQASTLTVDDDGGADFTEITDAIAAASHGDLILVAPGIYEDFTLSKGLTIIGSTGAEVDPGSRVSSLPGNRRAVLADLVFRDLRVVNCGGTVVLDSLRVAGNVTNLDQYVEIAGSAIVPCSGVAAFFFAASFLAQLDLLIE